MRATRSIAGQGSNGMRRYAPPVISVDQVRRSLSARRAVSLPTGGLRHAAVAMVLIEGRSGAEVLFIERARAPADPWSGHMAFPGGRVEPDDASGRAAAERETLEEVGLSLDGAEFLGRLDDKKGNPRTHPELVISAFVYLARAPGELVINSEVQDAFWFPLDGLLDRARHVHYTAHGEFEFPGILVGEPDRHVVWGLTYSFLESFFSVLGSPLPDRWTPEMRSFARQLEQTEADELSES
jgi:8-oxo-dGTP pyrophosphatase MutT (NUDIX family)